MTCSSSILGVSLLINAVTIVTTMNTIQYNTIQRIAKHTHTNIATPMPTPSALLGTESLRLDACALQFEDLYHLSVIISILGKQNGN